jgi:hypothetical protein
VEGLKWLEIKGFGRFCLFGANGSKEMIFRSSGTYQKHHFPRVVATILLFWQTRKRFYFLGKNGFISEGVQPPSG